MTSKEAFKELKENAQEICEWELVRLNIIEKELKALEIIKTKNVDIDYIKTCFYDKKGGFKDYNAWVGHDDDEELSQEEYDLLKEVLENDK